MLHAEYIDFDRPTVVSGHHGILGGAESERADAILDHDDDEALRGEILGDVIGRSLRISNILMYRYLRPTIRDSILKQRMISQPKVDRCLIYSIRVLLHLYQVCSFNEYHPRYSDSGCSCPLDGNPGYGRTTTKVPYIIGAAEGEGTAVNDDEDGQAWNGGEFVSGMGTVVPGYCGIRTRSFDTALTELL